MMLRGMGMGMGMGMRGLLGLCAEKMGFEAARV